MTDAWNEAQSILKKLTKNGTPKLKVAKTGTMPRISGMPKINVGEMPTFWPKITKERQKYLDRLDYSRDVMMDKITTPLTAPSPGMKNVGDYNDGDDLYDMMKDGAGFLMEEFKVEAVRPPGSKKYYLYVYHTNKEAMKDPVKYIMREL